MAPSKTKRSAIADQLRTYGLATYPGSHLKSPWPGHLDLAVKDKTFAYLSTPGEPFSISVKLPRSASAALILPNTKPTAYGLGKSGWVSASFEDEIVDMEMLKAWIDESYRSQAPKKLVAQLDAGGAGAQSAAPAKKAAAKKPAATKKPAAKKAPAKKPAAKKPAAKKR